MTPWSMQTSFYPRSFALQGAERLLDSEDIPQGTVRYLEETLGIKQVGYRDWITVRAPDQNEIAFFGLPADGRVPVYEIFRTAFDQNGTPMRVTVTIFPADRNQFIIDVGDVPAREYEPVPKI
jgi:GntR family transcriptional regulator